MLCTTSVLGLGLAVCTTRGLGLAAACTSGAEILWAASCRTLILGRRLLTRHLPSPRFGQAQSHS